MFYTKRLSGNLKRLWSGPPLIVRPLIFFAKIRSNLRQLDRWRWPRLFKILLRTGFSKLKESIERNHSRLKLSQRTNPVRSSHDERLLQNFRHRKSASEMRLKSYRKLAHQYHPTKPKGTPKIQRNKRGLSDSFQSGQTGQYDRFGWLFDGTWRASRSATVRAVLI